MAVDVTSFAYFTPVFTFLFIWVLIYALLTKVKWFGEKEMTNGLISFLTAMLFLITPNASQIVAEATPWVFLLGILITLTIVMFLFLGVQENAVVKTITENPVTLTVIFVVLGIIFLTAMSNVFGSFLLPGQGQGFWDVTKRTLYHPRTLGMLFLLVIVSYAVRFMTAEK
jgi:hypothetical protein